MASSTILSFEQSLQLTAAPAQVLTAFFDAEALAHWWGAIRSVTTPRPLGVYAIEWDSTPFQDDVLGTLGGVFHGTVMGYEEAREFFVADAYWLPPEGDPIGPMALEVQCRVQGPGTELYVRQSATEGGARWARYYELVAAGWQQSLRDLKHYLEEGAPAPQGVTTAPTPAHEPAPTAGAPSAPPPKPPRDAAPRARRARKRRR